MSLEINRENLRQINIRQIALKKEFGAFAFENAYKKLSKIRSWIIELEDLDYTNELPENIVNNINNFIEELLTHLRWLQNFDITASGNAKQDHDSFESRIDGFYNNFVNSVLTALTYLRQEADSKSKDKKSIQREQKNLIQIRKQYDEIITSLKQQQQKLQEEKTKIASTHGEIGAVKFGKHFESQAKENQQEAKKWLGIRDIFFWTLLIIIVANIIGYFGLFIANKINPLNIKPSDFFTLEYGLAKLALLTILSYAISFASRNFNINSNLAALNKHRKNVAETVSDFLASNQEKEDRTKILINATEAMFKHQPIGYLPKIESKDDGPIASIINNILKPFN